MKKSKKKEILEKTTIAHNEFMTLYNQYQNRLYFGYNFTSRLLEKHYKYKTYEVVNKVIKWFVEYYNDSYNSNIIIRDNGHCFLRIYDKDKNCFACYVFNKNTMYNSNYDTKMYRNNLIQKELFNKIKHYLISVPDLFQA